MKRYVIPAQSFDTRATYLRMEIKQDWKPDVRDLHEQNKAKIREQVLVEYGALDGERKLRDFEDIGPLPLSILSYHNEYTTQIRAAFVQGAYYPACVAAGALGERILNHLVIDLREDFKASDSYKKVYRKSSFDNWEVAIDALAEWGVLRPEMATAFTPD